MCSRMRTLHGPLSKGFMEFVNNLLKAVCGDILAMGSEQVQLNVPFAQWHLHSRIASTVTRYTGQPRR